MLVFPNSKINLGLNITQKRADGFHDIETVFYPVPWRDALEVIENHNSEELFTFSQSGILIDGKKEDNLIYKAWQLLSEIKPIPAIKVHVHKNIPMGVGLGGGSADAAFFIELIDKKFAFNLKFAQKSALASKLGSDCSFFIKNAPVLATGRGDSFADVRVDLRNYYILTVYPGIHSNTKEAYSNCIPRQPEKDLRLVVEKIPIGEWKDHLKNDFEETVFKRYPQIKELKDALYNSGAIYACMSGSGSSVFGIFDKTPNIHLNANYKFYLQTPASKIL